MPEAAPMDAEPVAVPTPIEEPPPPAADSAIPVMGETVPIETAPPPPSPETVPPAAPTGGFDVAALSEEEQKAHRDAKRFAKLLVSEIDLYNKTKAQDGRKNHDLYKRLKSDIDRSRQTYEKRFGKTVGKQYDYFHDEIVRILASNDSAALGSEYPGPTI